MQPCKFKRLEMRVGGLGLLNVSSELPTSITLLWKPSLGRKVSGLLLWKITFSSKDGFTGFGKEGLDSGGNSASELGSEGFWSSDPLSAMCLAARISLRQPTAIPSKSRAQASPAHEDALPAEHADFASWALALRIWWTSTVRGLLRFMFCWHCQRRFLQQAISKLLHKGASLDQGHF